MDTKTMSQLNSKRGEAFGLFNQEAHDHFARMHVLTDREMAIVSLAFIESALRHLLISRFTAMKEKTEDKLFLGSLVELKSKIDIARAMGLISTVVYSNILELAAIRNQFAHKYSVRSFNQSEVLTLLNKISLYTEAQAKTSLVKTGPEFKIIEESTHPGIRLEDSDGGVFVYMHLENENEASVPRKKFENCLKIAWVAIVMGVIFPHFRIANETT